MPVFGYGDNYGDRYGQVYSVEVLAVPATANVAGVDVGVTTDSGRVLVSATPSTTESGEALESGSISINAVVDGAEVIPVFESGSVSSTATPSIRELQGVVESGAIQSAVANTITEIAQALESGSVPVDVIPSITDRSLLNESGEITTTAAFRFNPFVTTDSDDPVDAFRTILQEVRSQAYALTRPDVYAIWEVDPQQRLNKPDPAVYIWSPTPGNFDRFSADGQLTTDTRNVELLVMTLSESKTHRYTESIIDIVGDYVDDNADLTVYEDVDVDTVSDERGDKLFGETDHYINTIEFSTARLRETDSLGR